MVTHFNDLKFLPMRLRDDWDVVKNSVAVYGPQQFEYASDRLKNDDDCIRFVVDQLSGCHSPDDLLAVSDYVMRLSSEDEKISLLKEIDSLFYRQ